MGAASLSYSVVYCSRAFPLIGEGFIIQQILHQAGVAQICPDPVGALRHLHTVEQEPSHVIAHPRSAELMRDFRRKCGLVTSAEARALRQSVEHAHDKSWNTLMINLRS